MDEVGARNPMRGVDWLRYNRSTLDSHIRADWEQAIALSFSIEPGTKSAVKVEVAESTPAFWRRRRMYWSDSAAAGARLLVSNFRGNLRPSWFAALRAGPKREPHGPR